ncbi:cytochrome P450 [Mollisia scopiformis]|uniref:Cytochrome P450 n=1 Tax=Mollisia scopiformis TaxID=149040 RepID=A0A194WVG5_MOLSC|nr:cytochrome P450 [Mollisia scopiformis]KUJ11582.1 cytochrome P450 [Mollisia scopiformis]
MTILQVLGTTLILASLLTIVEGLRRIFFHPLAHIPGPKLAALTWWYEFYFDVIHQGRYVFQIQELHKKYGPIIRVTPDEIHVNDVGFLDTVYAPSMSYRDKYEYQLRTLRVSGGVGTTVSHEMHRKRREALSPFFSRRNVLYLEPLITRKVEQLCQVIGKHAVEKIPANLSDLFFAFSNDVVTNFLFAHQSDLLSDEGKVATLRENSNSLLMGININKHFPWLPDFLESLPLSISKSIMPPGLIDMLSLFDLMREELLRIMKAKSSKVHDEKPLGPTGKESVYASVLDSPVLPPSEKALLRLEQEGALLVLAGGESPAKTLNVIFCHLLSNLAILSRLRTELATTSDDASWNRLEQLPYLSAVIEEGNRLSFGVTARAARIAQDTLTYKPSQYVTFPVKAGTSYTIPPGTPISITTLSSQTAETVFPDPFAFYPGRWLGEEGRERRKFQMAFGKGGRKCLGIELARAELYLVVFALIKKFDMTLWQTDESDVAFVHDFQVAMPKMESKGVRVMAELI